MREEQQDKQEKLYYTIREASEKTNLPAYTLRFWEKKFPFFAPQKSRGGHRRYQKKDIELILAIKDLLYQKGFTIEGAKKELRKERKSNNKPEVDLTWVRREIEEIIKLLE